MGSESQATSDACITKISHLTKVQPRSWVNEDCDQVLSLARREYEVPPALFKDLPGLLPTQSGRDKIFTLCFISEAKKHLNFVAHSWEIFHLLNEGYKKKIL